MKKSTLSCQRLYYMLLLNNMPDFQLEEQDKIKKDIDHKYRGHINEIILFRLRLIVFIGIFLHLIFVGLDMAAYPSYADTFFKIRIYDGLLAIIVLLASCSPKMKPQSVWLTNIGASIFIVGMCAMVFISDASSSRYYEGANLVFLATSIINPFYITHLAGCFLVWIAFYDLVMIYGHQTHFNILNFIFANYFMGLTALGVVLITKFFKNEHYNAFVRQERLKINEETLAALYCQADKLSKIDTLTATNNRRHFSDMLNKKI
ncbi:MAG: hypothetical protein KGJ11_02710, partial [Candidatus Omnitrophica bacterium]|nr:hypothetical protein [Candidatus Omnitrophota bacterium]